ncbi:MAG: PIN domain-containing protein [Caldilineaceae bacterium]
MNNLYIVDTHTLLWYLVDDAQLGQAAGQILDAKDSRLLLPVIAVAESLFILERRPMLYQLSISDVLSSVIADSRITVVALDQATVAKTLDCMVIPEMHDRQIVATALLAQTDDNQVAILTRDENIQNCDLVQTIW